MSNKYQNSLKVKDKTIAIRVNQNTKKKLEDLAAIKEITIAELIRPIINKHLKIDEEDCIGIFEFIGRAAEIIDQNENKERRK